MANLIDIGMPVNGRTRRFVTLPHGKFWYGCPACSCLVLHIQAFCVCGHDLRLVANLYLEEPN